MAKWPFSLKEILQEAYNLLNLRWLLETNQILNVKNIHTQEPPIKHKEHTHAEAADHTCSKK